MCDRGSTVENKAAQSRFYEECWAIDLRFGVKKKLLTLFRTFLTAACHLLPGLGTEPPRELSLADTYSLQFFLHPYCVG